MKKIKCLEITKGKQRSSLTWSRQNSLKLDFENYCIRMMFIFFISCNFFFMSCLKCYIDFDKYFFYLYNFDIFVYPYCVYIIIYVESYFNYFFVLYSIRIHVVFISYLILSCLHEMHQSCIFFHDHLGDSEKHPSVLIWS